MQRRGARRGGGPAVCSSGMKFPASPLLLVLAGALGGLHAEPAEPRGALTPEALRFADGTSVRTPADWARRRDELKQLFAANVYGHLPPRPDAITVERAAAVTDEKLGVSREDLVLHLTHAGRSLDLHVRLTRPLARVRDGKPPVVIRSGFGGGSAEAERAARPPGFPAPPEPTGPDLFTQHGYATASFRFTEAAADKKETARAGEIYALFGAEIDAGGLMAWAWAIHRVVDALEQEPGLDAGRVVVTGHSRNGKAALLAGAFDERIALTVPSHSGCAGAASFRMRFGNCEQLHNIAGFAPHWFRPDFGRFAGHVDELPVDQHLLLALVAPRALLQTEGTLDEWTNPQGAQHAYLAAKDVYRFLGAAEKMGIRFRPVGHVPSDEDVVAFADHVFFGEPLPTEFGALAYPAGER